MVRLVYRRLKLKLGKVFRNNTCLLPLPWRLLSNQTSFGSKSGGLQPKPWWTTESESHPTDFQEEPPGRSQKRFRSFQRLPEAEKAKDFNHLQVPISLKYSKEPRYQLESIGSRCTRVLVALYPSDPWIHTNKVAFSIPLHLLLHPCKFRTKKHMTP